MEEQLRSFLDGFRVKKGQVCSHTSKGTGSDPKDWQNGRYYIGKKWLDHFWTNYCNAIYKGARPTITEKPHTFTPLRVDFDFKASLDVGLERQYTTKTLMTIVALYQREIKKIIHPDAFNPKMLWCIVLEKPSPRVENECIKDGFHLHFPHFLCEAWVSDVYLRERVSKKMVERGIWDDATFLTPVEKFIDEKMARKPWMLYGSMNYKNRKSMPYLYNRWKKTPEEEKYGHVFDHNQREIPIEQIFSIQMGGRKNSVRYYLPRFLSVRHHNDHTRLSDKIVKMQETAKHKRQRRRHQVQKKRSDEEVLADLKFIQDAGFMEMISDERADYEPSWKLVGRALFDISQGSQDGLDMWIDFSRRSDKFVEGECEDIWDRMDLKDFNIGVIINMAKQDNPKEYQAWKNNDVRFFMFESLKEEKPQPFDIAKVFCKLFGDRFICADPRPKKDLWYEFRDHRWRETANAHKLRKMFVDQLMKEYIELQRELSYRVADICAELEGIEAKMEEADILKKERKHTKEKASRCSAIITYLKKPGSHNQILEMVKLELYDADFLKKINENRMLLCCENGVLDLEQGVFRPGLPSDYCTFSTGQHYIDYNDDDQEIRDLDDYLKKVFPNKKRRDYFLDFVCSCMQGGNVHKRFLVGTGDGDNAKSVTFEIIQVTFGSDEDGYVGIFPRELMVRATGSNSSSSARPELAQVRGKRIMLSHEITHREKLNIGFLKQATGNDSFFVRTLWEKGGKIKPMFTLMLQCNDPPKVPGHDQPTWNRIRVLDFEAKFVKPADLKKYPVPKSKTEQFEMKRFKADEHFDSKIPDLASALLWKLFQRFNNEYKERGLIEPEEVLASTNTYQADNDVYRRFINEKIEKEDDEDVLLEGNTYIRNQDMKMEFQAWYKENLPSYSNEKIGADTMVKELKKRLGVIEEREDLHGYGTRSRWYGYRILKEDIAPVKFKKQE